MMKTVLPKDQWPTYEEDRAKGRLVYYSLHLNVKLSTLFKQET